VWSDGGRARGRGVVWRAAGVVATGAVAGFLRDHPGAADRRVVVDAAHAGPAVLFGLGRAAGSAGLAGRGDQCVRRMGTDLRGTFRGRVSARISVERAAEAGRKPLRHVEPGAAAPGGKLIAWR